MTTQATFNPQAFIELALSRGVLKFGEFTLKSGRVSPYFFNAGLLNDGEALSLLAQGYADKLVQCENVGVIFGPAYKGIPFVAATAQALWNNHQINADWGYNRKEAKDHGEGGVLIGAPLQGRVLIIDDVISAGTSVRESVELIRAHGATPAAVSIALDRKERGKGELSAVQEVQRDYGMPVVAIATLDDLLGYLAHSPDLADNQAKVQAYRDQYGV